MNEAELIAHVRERADLDSTAAAHVATAATLRVLGSRLTEPEAEALAARVPDPLDADLTWRSAADPEPFDAEAFVERVREREARADCIDEADAETHAMAVASIVTDALIADGHPDVRARLSSDYDRLFDPGGTGTGGTGTGA